MEFKGRYYHLAHFTCVVCAQSLQGQTANHAKNKDGKIGLHCNECYSSFCKPFCTVCEREINGNFYEACGTHYHPHHFSCFKCGEKLGSEYKKSDNKPHCNKCIQILNKDKCYKCKLPIEDKRSIVGDRMFHFDCFKCFYCEELMGGGDCVKHEGQYYHYECYMDYQSISCHFCKDTIIGEYLSDKKNGHPVHEKCLKYYQDMQDL